MSSSEFEEWKALVGDPSSDTEVKKVMDDHWMALSEDQLLTLPNAKAEAIFSRTVKTGKQRIGYWKWIAGAAAMVLIAGSVIFMNAGDDRKSVMAGKAMATLTLKNGRTVVLDENKKGLVIDASKLTYDDGTSISADLETAVGDNKRTMLSVQTPRGGTYEVILRDGTHVWLNADSKLEFPDEFAASERQVKLSGEGYFEVAHDKNAPFKVISRTQEIAVLGTHFNLDAYEDEKIVRTTLLEGSVKVSNKSGEKFLRPGYQAANDGNQLTVAKTDVKTAVAWKNKQFLFERENIKAIMKKVERWYDVEVVYTGKISEETFSGGVSRFDNLSEILHSLESTGNVSFKVKDRTVYVSM